jgi:hypothetical protein
MPKLVMEHLLILIAGMIIGSAMTRPGRPARGAYRPKGNGGIPSRVPNLVSGISLLAFLIAGCSTDRQRGGQSSFKGSAAKSAPAAMSLAQGENQKGPSRQDYQRQISSGLIVPEGSKIIVTDLQADPATGEVRTNSMVIELSKPTKLERVETESQGTELGAHREDAVGLMTAKLKSVRWIQFLGFLLICAGLSTFHPWCGRSSAARRSRPTCWPPAPS